MGLLRLISQEGVKIRPLLPALKEKKRYILYQMDYNKISNKEIESNLRNFVGDLGLAKAGLKFIKNKHNKGILQVNNKSVDEIKTGLTLINKTRIRTLKVSGVLNKLSI